MSMSWGTLAMPTAPLKPDTPKPDTTALACLVATGIVLDATAGVTLAAAGSAATPRRTPSTLARAPDVVRLEDRLKDCSGRSRS